MTNSIAASILLQHLLLVSTERNMGQEMKQEARKETAADTTSSWQTNDDLPERRLMIQKILGLIKLMKPDKSQVSDKM